MSNAADLLASYGLSFSQGRDFVYANLGNPQIIYSTAFEYGVTFSMLAELYGHGVSDAEVIGFFDALGFDTAIPRLLGTESGTLNLSARSNSISTLSASASSSTPWVDSLISGESWDSSFVTYGFPTSMPASYASDFDLSYGWRALNNQEQSAFSNVVASQNQYINTDLLLSFGTIEVNASAVYQSSSEAFAYFPGDDLGGDVFLNREAGSEYYYSVGGYGIFTMAHELGHAMGLEHSFEGVRLNSAYDNTYYTAMSYTLLGGYEVEALDQGSSYSTYTVDAYRNELGIIDVAALQAIYGADMSTNTGDTVYVYNEAERAFTTASGHYHTIWDAGGTDTLDLSGAEYNSTINLNDYTLSSVSQRTSFEEAVDVAYAAGLTNQSAIAFVQGFIDDLGDEAFLNQNNLGIAYGVVIENVITGFGDDSVIDNEVNNQIYTGVGNDIVYLGAGGYDYVDGGTGNDIVVLNVASSTVKTSLDSDGYHLLADDFAATLVGIETIQFTDTSISIA
ncbi:Serralysin precursor [Marinomonas aquimarina]|uniref:Serralysin n=1 Tax=Marinomonas aquimarina TaxID=295068 RepID=A0A1A8T4E4_9GAMM|nr:M10 family metallopeptidase C-terminal domain-containing protein [Marinomonas aquimarina]SBS25724.1 Serralysin precursor [Marinomonas aquimarina]